MAEGISEDEDLGLICGAEGIVVGRAEGIVVGRAEGGDGVGGGGGILLGTIEDRGAS